MLYIGLMSGTSMDAVDAALVDIANNHIKLIDYRQYPIPQELHKALKSVSGNSSIDLVTRLDVRMGRLFAEAANDLLRENNLGDADIAALGCHGQTLLHRPEPPEPTTLQIGDPNIIAHATGIATVADFRRMDIAAGGQGAPLTPVLHSRLFRHQTINRGLVNIGGMANITVLPAWQTDLAVYGYDTGPGNILLDEWARQHTGHPMDTDGCWAASGSPNQELLEHFLADDYFLLEPPKTTGRDYFNLHWLQEKLDGYGKSCAPNDVQATLVELTAISIANEFNKQNPAVTEVMVCGGGAHNPQMMRALNQHLARCEVQSTAVLGINPDALEAMTFAWLAKCRMDGITGNLPAVTGAAGPVLLGCIYTPHGQR